MTTPPDDSGGCSEAGRDWVRADEPDIYERGKIVWHSSEEDGGPDVGRSVGLGNGRSLWFGEISRKAHEEAGEDAAALGSDCGTWIVLYDETKPRGGQMTVIGKAVDGYVGQDVCAAISAALDAVQPRGGEEREHLAALSRARSPIPGDMAQSAVREPTDREVRLMAAIEGECHGLAISEEQAAAIMAHVDGPTGTGTDSPSAPGTPEPSLPDEGDREGVEYIARWICDLDGVSDEEEVAPGVKAWMVIAKQRGGLIADLLSSPLFTRLRARADSCTDTADRATRTLARLSEKLTAAEAKNTRLREALAEYTDSRLPDWPGSDLAAAIRFLISDVHDAREGERRAYARLGITLDETGAADIAAAVRSTNVERYTRGFMDLLAAFHQMEAAETAESFARRAHAGQVDKAGLPYTGHLMRVAARARAHAEALGWPPEHAQLVRDAGWLHDLIEDRLATADDLEEAGMPLEVIAAVERLDRVTLNLSHAGHVRRIIEDGCPIALLVKLADAEDNADPSRPVRPGVTDALLERYAKSAAMLRGAVLELRRAGGGAR